MEQTLNQYVGGYCYYLLIDHNGEPRIEWLTSGIILGKNECIMPPSLFKTPQEIFDFIERYISE